MSKPTAKILDAKKGLVEIHVPDGCDPGEYELVIGNVGVLPIDVVERPPQKRGRIAKRGQVHAFTLDDKDFDDEEDVYTSICYVVHEEDECIEWTEDLVSCKRCLKDRR